MKVNLRDHLRSRESLLQHMVLTVIANTLALEEVASSPEYNTDGTVDMVLTVNGHELDVEKFCQHWQSQVDRMIKEHAAELVEEKFAEISEVFDGIRRSVEEKLGIDTLREEEW